MRIHAAHEFKKLRFDHRLSSIVPNRSRIVAETQSLTETEGIPLRTFAECFALFALKSTPEDLTRRGAKVAAKLRHGFFFHCLGFCEIIGGYGPKYSS